MFSFDNRLVLYLRQRRKKASSEGKGTRFKLGGRQPYTKNENRSYEKPWNDLKILNFLNAKFMIKRKVKVALNAQFIM